METPKPQYFEYLDALRCLAFLVVFYAHSCIVFLGTNLSDGFPLNIYKKFIFYGVYGVNFFFVLSGFLITYLLIKEKRRENKISIKNFYLKRILRIWPVYFIILFSSYFILPLLIPSSTYEILKTTDPTIAPSAFWYFLAFIGNFYRGYGLDSTALVPMSLGILWSVCVEEQFYLVWPWFVKYLNEKKLLLLTILLISLSLLYKFVWLDDRIASYYLTWSVGMDLGFGVLFAILYLKKTTKQIVVIISSIFGGFLLFTCGFLGIVYLQIKNLKPTIVHNILSENIVEILRLVKSPLIDCVFILILLFFANKIASVTSGTRHPIISALHITKNKLKNALFYLGKISYGLYAYHPMCLMLTASFFYSIGFIKLEVSQTVFFVTISLALLLTVLVSHLSSKFIEKRFISMRNKLK